MDLIKYISDIFKGTGIAALFLARPKQFPGISYHTFGESGGLYGDGEAKTNAGSLQIDLFSKDSSCIRPLRKKIIAAFKASKWVTFLKSNPDETKFEEDTQLYHHVLVFNFTYMTESEVL